jgi:hypothetical protein
VHWYYFEKGEKRLRDRPKVYGTVAGRLADWAESHLAEGRAGSWGELLEPGLAEMKAALENGGLHGRRAVWGPPHVRVQGHIPYDLADALDKLAGNPGMPTWSELLGMALAIARERAEGVGG